MQSKVDTPIDLQEKTLELLQERPRFNDILPLRFISILSEHHSTTDEVDAHGQIARSPIIVALGDSVTAGWFEGNTRLPQGIKDRFFAGAAPIEHVSDIASVYHEQFRLLLSDCFERSSPSVINSGISGDTVTGILSRIGRDILNYNPHLLLLHASLNGPENLNIYERDLEKIIKTVQLRTDAEIIIITPNLMIKEIMGTLPERAMIMLELAEKHQLSVVDQYSTWLYLEKNGVDSRSLLSNELNHPTKFAHYITALELMKLFK